jgi:hypothetical protein
MSLKLKALLQLVGLVALAVGIERAIHYINTYVSTETLVAVFQYGLIGVLLYSCWNLLLTRLEMNQKYKELDK